jgi:hypothetical protein
VVINEIMYHPASQRDAEEFVELWNRAATPVALAGWRLDGGIRFLFPDVALEPGAFLVIAADPAAFLIAHPEVPQPAVVGGWQGVLSNDGERLELLNAADERVDMVRFADDGDWALRARDVVDAGHSGWTWHAPHDGLGASLELINPSRPRDSGQNWDASRVPGGTPGRTNSAFSAQSAPLIHDVRHVPAIPRSIDPIRIQARVLSDPAASTQMWLHYRLDGAPGFAVVPMTHDGLAGDLASNDGAFGAVLPPQPAQAVIEFYIEARDAEQRTRFWPAAVLQSDGSRAHTANALLQVDDTPRNAAGFAEHRLILTASDLAALRQINANHPPPPFPTTDQTRSHASFGATFITSNDGRVETRYLVDVRNRGNGSRFRQPQSFRVNFQHADPWGKREGLNLNTQYPFLQILASAMFRRAGVAAAFARPVHLRVNNADHTAAAASPALSGSISYIAELEPLGASWAQRHVPHDPSGNVYRGIRLVPPGANLTHLGASPDPYRPNYFKITHTGADDWTDLAQLTRTFAEAPESAFLAEISRVLDLDAWLGYFAVNTLLDNNETCLANGDGDDYFLYRGREDTRFRILPHDLDTVFGLGDNPGQTNASLFRAAGTNAATRGFSPPIQRFLQHPDVAPRYFDALSRLLETAFAASSFEPWLEHQLAPLVTPDVIQRIKQWTRDRTAFVQSQIPRAIAIEPPPGLSNLGPAGFLTTVPRVLLSGRADAIGTRFVLVNGVPATWVAWQARWEAAEVPLLPAANRVLVQALDGNGAEIQRESIDLWYDAGPGQMVGGPIAADATWVAASGPYLVTNVTSIAPAATLRIEPGTTVTFLPAAGLVIGGRLLAEGVETRRIRFTRPAASGGRWNGLLFQDTAQPSRLAFIDLHHAGTQGAAIVARRSTVLLDRLTFADTLGSFVELEDAAFDIRGCQFPAATGVEPVHGRGLPADGFGIIEGNRFATTTGLNDIIDFTGGQRPNAILQLYDNSFSGGSDDALDLDGTDAHIEGNVFLGIHQSASLSDSSSAISGGRFGKDTSELTIVRNLFFDCDHVALAKEGNFYLLEHNTAWVLSRAGMVFDEPERRISSGVTPGRGARLHGNIFWQTPVNFEYAYNNDPQWGTINLEVDRSILGGRDVPANATQVQRIDPRFTQPNAQTVNADSIRTQLRLAAGSPALGTAGFGLDMGGLVPGGAAIDELPPRITFHTSVTVRVGGPGITHYRAALGSLPAAPDGLAVPTPVATFGPWTDPAPVTSPLRLEGLTNGTYQLAVIGQNSAGVWQASPPPVLSVRSAVAFERLPPTLSPLWTVDTQHAWLRINEVLAVRLSNVASGNHAADFIELFNDSATPADLTGFGLTDDRARPFRFVIPPNTVIPASGYVVVEAGSREPETGLATGFGLSQHGDAVYLFRPTAQGPRLVDQIVFGRQVTGFSVGRRQDDASRWAIGRPTPGAANLPVAMGDPSEVRIQEWLAIPGATFRTPFVELLNPQAFPVDLSGFALSVHPFSRGNDQRFPELSFLAAHDVFAVMLHPGEEGSSGAPELSLPQDQGDLALLDPQGRVIDLVQYWSAAADTAEGRLTAGGGSIHRGLPPTPGSRNPAAFPGSDGPRLSEVFAGGPPVAGLPPPGPHWIELYNPGTNSVPLEGMSLTRGLDLVSTWPFPTSATLPPNGFAMVYFDPSQPASSTNTGFALLATGDRIALNDTPARGGGLIDAVTFGLQTPAFTLGRAATHPFDWRLTVPTPGGANTPARLGPSSDLRINEWLANPSAGRDWFELANLSPFPVDLSGLWLADDLASHEQHPIAPRSFIGPRPHAFLRFDADGTPERGAHHVSFKLRADGEAIGLFTAEGLLIDAVGFGRQIPGVSEGRVPDGSGPVAPLSAGPTPGRPNDPLDTADSDGDGLPDAWEQTFDLDPRNAADATTDNDRDGMSNLEEHAAGTNPVDSADRLAIESLSLSANGRWQLEFVARAGHSYTVEASEALLHGVWRRVGDVDTGPSTRRTAVEDTAGIPTSARWYRLVTPRRP